MLNSRVVICNECVHKCLEVTTIIFSEKVAQSRQVRHLFDEGCNFAGLFLDLWLLHEGQGLHQPFGGEAVDGDGLRPHPTAKYSAAPEGLVAEEGDHGGGARSQQACQAMG